MMYTEHVRRALPTITDRNRFFWEAGRDGTLRILRCDDCGYYLHPPQPCCGRCRSARVAPAEVSGFGTVYSFTVNEYEWVPGFPPPYVVAQVELVEQEGLRLLSNLVGCDADELSCGLGVEVVFARHGDVYIPLFVPRAP